MSLKSSEEFFKSGPIDKAPHLSREAKLVKLADKICNLRDILAAPRCLVGRMKARLLFLAGKVVAGIRGVHPRLETVFDALVERQREIC